MTPPAERCGESAASRNGPRRLLERNKFPLPPSVSSVPWVGLGRRVWEPGRAVGQRQPKRSICTHTPFDIRSTVSRLPSPVPPHVSTAHPGAVVGPKSQGARRLRERPEILSPQAPEATHASIQNDDEPPHTRVFTAEVGNILEFFPARLASKPQTMIISKSPSPARPRALQGTPWCHRHVAP